MKDKYAKLTSEKSDFKFRNLDKLPTDKILDLINKEDCTVAIAVKKVLPSINKVVNLAVNSLQNNGRIIYIGAGTSGRLGVLDASECPPTFGVTPNTFIGVIAGGNGALIKSKEGAEDSKLLGIKDIEKLNISSNDLVIGISASGSANYVLGALKKAKSQKAKCVLIATVSKIKKPAFVNEIINPITGAEIISGSTRMKAGTATKMILNMISTTAMIKTGKVYSNLMVDLNPLCTKLKIRSRRILKTITNASDKEADSLLKSAGNKTKVAIVMSKLNISSTKAEDLLFKNNGNLRNIIG